MHKVIYENGYNYAFNPNKCKECKGKCCIGESGFIWISKNEIQKFAKYLNISEDIFKVKYLIKIGFRYSLKEVSHDNGFACIFFDTLKSECSAYECRPNQCKTFPFWEYFKNNKKELEDECIGILHL